nr:hypothetical protein [Tanacetum cinerariifolium]
HLNSTCVTRVAPRPAQFCMSKEASCALCSLLESGAAVPDCTLQH